MAFDFIGFFVSFVLCVILLLRYVGGGRFFFFIENIFCDVFVTDENNNHK